jgi:hypothetical protein
MTPGLWVLPWEMSAFICKRAVMMAIAEIIRSSQEKATDRLLVSAAPFKGALQVILKYEAPRTRDGVVQA